MADTIEKILLSGSTNGLPIKVVATATLGTVIHTADLDALDEVWLWAVNTSGAGDVKLTIEFGGATDPDCLIEQTIRAEDGCQLVIPGLPLTNLKAVTAFAALANLVTIVGFVNRIVQT